MNLSTKFLLKEMALWPSRPENFKLATVKQRKQCGVGDIAIYSFPGPAHVLLSLRGHVAEAACGHETLAKKLMNRNVRGSVSYYYCCFFFFIIDQGCAYEQTLNYHHPLRHVGGGIGVHRARM